MKIGSSIVASVSSFNPCYDGIVNDGVPTKWEPGALDGVHTHPTMCNAYYYCNNGTQSTDRFCPEGLLFNGETCDFPHSVQCETECAYDDGLRVWHGDEGTWEAYGGFKPENETNLREDFNMFDDDFETYWHSAQYAESKGVKIDFGKDVHFEKMEMIKRPGEFWWGDDADHKQYYFDVCVVLNDKDELCTTHGYGFWDTRDQLITWNAWPQSDISKLEIQFRNADHPAAIADLKVFYSECNQKAKRPTKSSECWNMQDNTSYKTVSSDEPIFAKFRNLDDAIKECDRLGSSKCGTINYSNACCGANNGWYQLRPQLQAVNNNWTGYRVYTRSENYDSC